MNHKVPGDGEGLAFRAFQSSSNHQVPGTKVEDDNAGVQSAKLKWCTIDCDSAAWPKENVDGAKSCRTFNALWCNDLDTHVTRNTPCTVLAGARRPKPNW